jgi:hypothetical protein
MNKDKKQLKWEKLLPEVLEARKRGDLLSEFLQIRDMKPAEYHRIKPKNFRWAEKKETDIPVVKKEVAPPPPKPIKQEKVAIMVVKIENLSEVMENLI